MSIDVSIVILNYNTREYLRYCLASLYEHPPECSFEVIVVDNASSDGSTEMIGMATAIPTRVTASRRLRTVGSIASTMKIGTVFTDAPRPTSSPASTARCWKSRRQTMTPSSAGRVAEEEPPSGIGAQSQPGHLRCGGSGRRSCDRAQRDHQCGT